MRKKINTIILAVICLNAYVFAQSDYRPGFVIMNTNDTVYGLIDYKGDISNGRICSFKMNKDDKSIEYKPFEVIGYRFIDDKFYISKEINLNGEKLNVFLEYLLQGKVDLYCYRNIDGIFYFIQKNNDNLHELKDTEVKTYVNGVEYIKKDNLYKGMLKYLFMDAPEIQNKVDDLNLNRKSLISISEDYHNHVCKDSKCIIYKKKLPKVKVSIGKIGGVDISNVYNPNKTITITFPDPDPVRKTYFCDYEKSINPTAGLYMNVPFPYTHKLSFQYEGLLSAMRLQSHYYAHYDSENILNEPYTIKYKTLNHNFYIRYEIFNSKFRPFIMAGGSINHNFDVQYGNFEKIKVIPFHNVVYYGLSYGIGFAYKFSEKREIFCRLLMNNEYNVLEYLDSKTFSFAVGFPLVAF